MRDDMVQPHNTARYVRKYFLVDGVRHRMHIVRMSLGDFIRGHGFRQDHIAAELGITQTQFSRICCGHSPLSVARIYQLAAIMRLPVADVAAAVIPELNTKESMNGTAGTPTPATAD
jgi:hypothetical protein